MRAGNGAGVSSTFATYDPDSSPAETTPSEEEGSCYHPRNVACTHAKPLTAFEAYKAASRLPSKKGGNGPQLTPYEVYKAECESEDDDVTDLTVQGRVVRSTRTNWPTK